ncbi:MAG: hypothetical protein PHS04_15885 [Tissierellia bacterium]|nr:hypothetical protein [Tissierellia bacterium]MDD4439496.1 hypothetical protein [Tissierellia bacterium]
MEKKNNFMPLLIYSIKEKKNWVFLSTVIIFLTTLLIPYILRADEEFFIMFGIVELFILVLINCLVDNSFLHNESKLTYYRSKPVTLSRQVIINIVTNAVFTVYLLVLIVLSVVFQGLDNEILEVFKMLIPWLSAIILLASLSSILSGNTLMAGAMTIFNFCLPLIILLVTMFIFSILENIVIGFSADVLNDYFINNIYRLDYLYFTRYVDSKSIDLAYLLLLPIILIFISLLLHKFIKRRKNENTGFIVFNGFKYFVAVLACLMIPASFSISLARYTTMANRIIISALLAVLSYYIIIAFIEKSFRISRSSIKVFMVSMVVFAAITGGTVAVASQYKNVVPDPEDVQMAYVGNQRWSINEIDRFLKGDYKSENTDFSEWKRNRNIVTYEDKDIIGYITELHKEILKDQTFYHESNYYGVNNFVIAYWMKDGSTIIRDYTLAAVDGPTDEHAAKAEIANKLLNSIDYKKQKFYYIYDEEYYSGRNLYADYKNVSNYNNVIKSSYLNDLRGELIKDIDNLFVENDMAFIELFMNYNINYDKEIMLKEQGYIIEIYEKISDNEKNYIDEIYLNDNFTNTLEYLE